MSRSPLRRRSEPSIRASGLFWLKFSCTNSPAPARSKVARWTGLSRVSPRSWLTWASISVYVAALGSFASGLASTGGADAGASDGAAATHAPAPLADADGPTEGAAVGATDGATDATDGDGLAAGDGDGLGAAWAHAATRATRSARAAADRDR